MVLFVFSVKIQTGTSTKNVGIIPLFFHKILISVCWVSADAK